MQFNPSPATQSHAERLGKSLKALANWTHVSRRYRDPSSDEACKAGIGTRHPNNSKVVNDEGLLFVNDGETIHVYTTFELAIC